MPGLNSSAILSQVKGSYTLNSANYNADPRSDSGRYTGYGVLSIVGACARGFRVAGHAFTGFLLLTMLVVGAARAQVASSETSERVQALTQSLASVAAQFAASNVSNRGALRGELIDLAGKRHAALLDLIDEAPGEVLKAELPSRVVGRLPAEVRDLLEYRGAIEGELQVVQIDHENPGESYLEYGLVTVYGERVSLHFAGAPTHRLTGERVIARGLILEGDEETAMALESGEDGIEAAYCCESGSGSTSEPELPNTFGAQSTATLLVNFVDDTSEPWTVAEIHELMFGAGGVSDYFFETSHDQTWLAGDTFGWLTVALPANTCELFQFAELVYQAAADAGIDLSPYDRRVIFTPVRSECGFAGAASIGGSPSVARLNGRTRLQVVTHEMGHNFGLHHGHSLNCGLVTLGDACTHGEYGDRTDTMGSPDSGHVSAFHKQRLGWLADAATGELESVTDSGTHTLDPYETLPGSQPKAIRIPAGVDPANGKQRWLYLTYRQPIGFDSFYADRSYSTYCRDDVTDGVYGHLGTDGAPGSSYLLNLRTNSCWVDFYGTLDWYNPRLAPGESFTIPDSGATITVDMVDANGATVYVDMGGPASCVPADPQVAVTALGDGWGAPGETESYDVTVTNADSSVCAPATFDLSAAAPSGWAASFASSALTLGPGESGSTTLALTSATSAADGTYDVPATASNGPDSGSAMATYVVSGSLQNNPPIAVDDDASTDSNTSVTIPVMANDYDPDGDPLAVTVLNQPNKGTVELNADGTVTYTPGNKANGSDSFGYTVSDGAGSASATVQIAFTKGGGGGGNGKGKGPNK